MQDLYYIEQFSKDEKGNLVPMVLSVLAASEDDARALIVDCYSELVPNGDLGEVHKALRSKHGFVLTKAKIESA